jgi:membrane fusion protein
MTQPLIRPEVFVERRTQWLGEVRLHLPSMVTWMAMLSVLSALVLMLLLTFGSYTRRATVVGEIVPSAGLLKLNAHATGLISALYVEEGTKVQRGDTLMLISAEQSSAAMGDTASLVADQLSLQAQRIDKTMQLSRLDAERSGQALQQELLSLKQERLLIEAQRDLRERQLAQAKAALARVAPLQESGVLARRQVEEYQQVVLNAEDALNETRLRLLAQERRQREVAQQLAAQPSQAVVRDTELRGEQTALTQALAETEAARVLRVVAPSDGVVTGLSVQLGQSVAAERQLLTLIPEDSALVAQLWVPSAAAGRLAIGTTVLLRVDAFPHQHYGRVPAIVTQVAASALGPEEIRRIADRAPDYPAFRVIATLPSSASALPLRASMSLVGDVQLERRRLIQWMYAPLFTALGATQ